ncbi:MAG: vWA domain-containing protein [Pseudomonadota bacterium]
MNKSWLAALTLGLGLPAAAAPDAAPATQPDVAVHSYILLDRTGSMSGIWGEALSSVNAYATSIGEAEAGDADIKTEISLAVFDAQEGLQFDVLRRSVGAEDWAEVTDAEAAPRGMTPLYDAIGRLVSLAEADGPEKAVLVIMTDGLENASREMTGDGAKAALDRARERGWEVVFLGAEFANFSDADAVGVSGQKSIAVGSGRFSSTMSNLAKKSRDYAQEPEAEIVFDAEDRAASGEEDVKDRTGQ